MSFAEVSGIFGFQDEEDSILGSYPAKLSLLTPKVPIASSCSCSVARPSMSVADSNNVRISDRADFLLESVDLGLISCPCNQSGSALLHVVTEVSRDRRSIGSITLVPNLEKRVNRMITDSAMFINVFGYPLTRQFAHQYCCLKPYVDCAKQASGCPPVNLPSVRTVYPRRAGFKEFVYDDPSVAEEVFAYDTFCAYNWVAIGYDNHDLSITVNTPCPTPDEGDNDFDTCACLDGIPGNGHRYTCYFESDGSFPTCDTQSESTGNPDQWDELYHDDSEVRSFNQWAHPHFAILDNVPAEADTAFWKAEASKKRVDLYWGKVREQYFDDDLSPTPKTRNSVQSEPWLEGILGSYLETYGLGAKTSWFGICDFDAVQPVVPVSRALDSDSSSRWSTTHGTPTFGASDITITPSGSPITFIFTLASFTVTPFMQPMIASQIEVDWDSDNIESVEVQLVSESGQAKTFATAPGTYARPNFDDTKYAGSWARDFGLGQITDEGADTRASGISALVMIDPTLIVAYSLLAGFTAVSLKFIITPIDTGVDVTINYPVFHYGTTPTILVETGQNSAILYPSGPGVRFGNWNWWNGAALETTPTVRDPGSMQTVLDGLVTKRVLFEGKAPDDGLDAEIASLYDSVEGQTRDDVTDWTHCFITQPGGGGTIILVNSYRETPPLAMFPRRSRDANYQRTGAFAQESWFLARGARLLLSRRAALKLVNPDDESVLTTAFAGVPAGWFGATFNPALTNDEGDGYEIRVGDRGAFATCSPFHGYTGVIGLETVAAEGSLHMTKTPSGIMALVKSNDEGVTAYRFNIDDATIELTVAVHEDSGVTDAQIAYHPKGELRIAFAKSGIIYGVRSSDFIETWSDPEELMNGTRVAIADDDHAGMEFIAAYDSGDWKLYRKLETDDSFVEKSTILSATESGAGLEFRDDGSRRLIFAVVDGTDIRKFVSTDFGETWIEV